MTSDDFNSELDGVMFANTLLGEKEGASVSVSDEGEIPTALLLLLLGSAVEILGNASGEGAKFVEFVTLLVLVESSNCKLGLLLGTPSGSEGLGLGPGFNSETFALRGEGEGALSLKFCEDEGEGEKKVELDMMAMYCVLCILCMTKWHVLIVTHTF